MIKKDWYSPGEINYTKSQVLWLLPNLPSILLGEWPPEHKETGYIGKSRHRKASAYFEPSVQVGAELSLRIKLCKRDGLMVMARYVWGEDEISLSNYFDLPYQSVIQCLETAIRYCCGSPRKFMPYRDYKKQSNYRRRHRID